MKSKMPEYRVGVHTSIAGGIPKSIERAVSLGCNTMQIFSHNPRQWKQSSISEEEKEKFALLRAKYNIFPVFIHTSYLINLASGSDTILNKSIELLSYEMRCADQLGVEYVVLHTGSASGEDEKKARKRAVKSLLKPMRSEKYNAELLLENTAGERGDITSSVKTLADIIDMCHCEGIGGICIDTCHAFAAGYDLTSVEGMERLMGEINTYVGTGKLKLIHLNDSKRSLGSGVDRHEHIGEGSIGIEGFKHLLKDRRINSVPMILETPKKSDEDDRRNLKRVRTILTQNV